MIRIARDSRYGMLQAELTRSVYGRALGVNLWMHGSNFIFNVCVWSILGSISFTGRALSDDPFHIPYITLLGVDGRSGLTLRFDRIMFGFYDVGDLRTVMVGPFVAVWQL